MLVVLNSNFILRSFYWLLSLFHNMFFLRSPGSWDLASDSDVCSMSLVSSAGQAAELDEQEVYRELVFLIFQHTERKINTQQYTAGRWGFPLIAIKLQQPKLRAQNSFNSWNRWIINTYDHDVFTEKWWKALLWASSQHAPPPPFFPTWPDQLELVQYFHQHWLVLIVLQWQLQSSF